MAESKSPVPTGGRSRSASTGSNSSTADFVSELSMDAVTRLSTDLKRLLSTVAEAERKEVHENFDGFQKLFNRYMEDRGTKIQWSKIKPPPVELIVRRNTLAPIKDEVVIREILQKVVVLKLNGGLGTSMGCTGPKSAISVRDDLTFLDLTVRQIENLNKTYDVDVPLVLMNSFNTHVDTEKILRKYTGCRCDIRKFNQSRYPRILKESLHPLPSNNSNNSEWYPPGHGDLYESLKASGTLDALLGDGIEYVFVSNIDNLGATLDLDILYDLVKVNPDCEYVMEVTDKTKADVKGGTLITYEDKLRLLEIAQVPKEHVDEFKSISKFRIFNTNNLWIKLEAINRLYEEGSLHMEVIENKKTLDDGRAIIQLETAVGSAIKNFANAKGINVPRKRFLPVKKTQDLLLVMSNLYSLQQGTLRMNPKRAFPTVPLVKLGSEFAKVAGFLSRFETIPDILELDHLTVSGDVTFGARVVLKGTVIIIANHGERINIPAGSILENKIVSGNLRILDH